MMTLPYGDLKWKCVEYCFNLYTTTGQFAITQCNLRDTLAS